MKKRNVVVVLVLFLAAIAFYFYQLYGRDGLGNTVESGTQDSAPIAYFDVLREAQRLLRQSPDHLPANYFRIIESHDSKRLIEFIRTSFDVVPPSTSDWHYSISAQRWGNEGTLRSGAGTPRELAELLRSGLEKMGYEAKVVTQQAPSALRSFNRTSESRQFVPGGNWRQYQSVIKGKALPPGPIIQPHPQLWKNVASAIPHQKHQNEAFDATISELPSVLFSREGGDEQLPQLANLWADGDSLISQAKHSVAGRQRRVPEVEVAVLVGLSDRPDKPVEVLKAQWSQAELAGKRVSLSFVPLSENLETLLATRPSNLTTFTPVLKIENVLPGISAERSFHEGAPFSARGELLVVDGDEFRLGRRQIASDGDPDRVARLEIKSVSTAHYPWLELRVDVLDNNDRSVPALPASVFTATLNDRLVGLGVQQNRPRAPRIVFLADTSGSVDPMYLGENLSLLVFELAEEIKTVYPDAVFRTGIVEGKSASFLAWTDSPSDVAADTQHVGFDSPLWRAYAAAIKQEPDTVVFITDGVAASRAYGLVEAMPEELMAEFAVGPPAIMLGAGSSEHPLGAAFEGIAESTGGVALDISNKEQAIATVLALLVNRSAPYELLVRAGDGAEAENAASALSVRLAVNSARDEALVPVPARNEISPPPSISGLYLRITSSDGTVIRRLAGTSYQSAVVTEEQRQNARLGLFGQYTLMVEAGSVSLSQALDDALSSRLSWEAVINAEGSADLQQALARVQHLPPSAFGFSVPLFDSKSHQPVYQTGMRYWLDSTRRVRRGEQEYEQRRVDLVPLTRFFSADPKPDKAFATALLAGAKLSELEAAMYSDNALVTASTNWDYAEYSVTGDATRNQQFRNLKAGWPHFEKYVVPATGEIKSAFGIDMKTGTLIGIIEDGSGGGITEAEVNNSFDTIDNILDAVETYMSGPPAAWAKLEKAKMSKLRVATIMIVKMEVPDWEGMIRDAACDAASGAVDSVIEAGVRATGGETAVDLLGVARDSIETADTFGTAFGLGSVDASVAIPGCS